MMKKFTPLILWTLIVGACHYVLFLFLPWEFRMIIPAIYVYMLLFSAFFEHKLMTDIAANRFITNYMAFSGGKLILSMFLLLIYAVFNRDYVKPFAVSFLIVYFSFSAFEIVRLLRFFKK